MSYKNVLIALGPHALQSDMNEAIVSYFMKHLSDAETNAWVFNYSPISEVMNFLNYKK